MSLPYMYEPEVMQHAIGLYREALVAAGHDAATHEILGKLHIYVTETAAEVEAAVPYLLNYERVSRAGIHRRRAAAETTPGIAKRDRQGIAHEIATGNVIAGTPDHCIAIIRRLQETLGLSTISGTFFFGGLPQDMALRNIRLFAEEVMPAFREPAPHTAGAAPAAGRSAS
jgi:alkanesulfonate monooxygenase SsuD/methylene tetrahydromethanopterin reductase-like flavin-dependent oxidoreductase (luciferase family)